MKNSILFALLLTGLALAGCNSSTRSSNTATDTVPTTAVAVQPSAPYSVGASPATAANTNTNASTNSSPYNESSTAAPSASAIPSNPPPSPGTGSTYSSTDTALAISPPVPPDPRTAYANGAGAPPHSVITPGALDTSRLANDLASSTATGAIAGRISEWRLSAAEIQSDLDRGGMIVRTKNGAVSGAVDSTHDDVIRMMIQGKLQSDSETSRSSFEVETKGGEVTLKGTADSVASIGRAIALALDTKGVTKVSADAKVGSSSK